MVGAQLAGYKLGICRVQDSRVTRQLLTLCAAYLAGTMTESLKHIVSCEVQLPSCLVLALYVTRSGVCLALVHSFCRVDA